MKLTNFSIALFAFALSLATCVGGAVFQELYSFPNTYQVPQEGIVMGTDGTLYGVASSGGNTFGFLGGVYSLDTNGIWSALGDVPTTPTGPLVLGPDNFLYGECSHNGSAGFVYRASTAGGVSTAFNFASTGVDDPAHGMIVGSDGVLYGSYAGTGISSSHGGVFGLTTLGVLTTLAPMSPSAGTGTEPEASLLQIGSDFYGTTYTGGTFGLGTVFKLSQGASSPVTIFTFNGTNGSNPRGGLAFGPDNLMYGITEKGGTNNNGTVFRLSPGGGNFSNLVRFTDNTGLFPGSAPYAKLTYGPDGFFYGTTSDGGVNGNGTVFKINTAGQFISLYAFDGGTGVTYTNASGFVPQCSLVTDGSGMFFGTTSGGGTNGKSFGTGGTLFQISTNGAFKVLYAFGAKPGTNASELVFGADGNLYGTCSTGGQQPNNGFIFRFSPITGACATLGFFSATNGYSPRAAMVQDTNGDFYGTTFYGGSNLAVNGTGFGTIFKITTSGQLSNIFSFSSDFGSSPSARLIRAPDGFFYGTTSDAGPNGNGTIFRFSATTAPSNLVAFTGASGQFLGAHPKADLILGQDGNLYGTTEGGGSSGGYGTVFRLNLPSLTFSNLASFDGSQGSSPDGRLVQADDGTFYGTARTGPFGSSVTNGTIFQLTSSGLVKIYTFGATNNAGASPVAGLMRANDGNFYGTTSAAGTNGTGTVYRFETNGRVTVLFSFNDNPANRQGSTPNTPLVQAPDGSLIGTTSTGASNIRGNIYKLSLGLNPLLPPTKPRFTSLTNNVNGRVQLSLVTDINAYWPVSVQASTNLLSWATIATNVPATNGIYSVIDNAQSTNFVRRFYRATSP